MGLYRHWKRVCTESWPWEENSLLHQGIELASDGVTVRCCKKLSYITFPGRSSRRIFFSRVNCLCRLFLQHPFHPCITVVTFKRPQSFCPNCRWQVQLNTHTPLTQQSWSGLTVLFRHSVGSHQRSKRTHSTHQGTLIHSHFSSLSHCGLILGLKEWNWCAQISP